MAGGARSRTQRLRRRTRRAPAWIVYDDGTVRPWGHVPEEEAEALDVSYVPATGERGRPVWLVKEAGDA